MAKKIQKKIKQSRRTLLTSFGTRERALAEGFFHQRPLHSPGSDLAEASKAKDGFAAVLERQADEFSNVDYCQRRAGLLSRLSKNSYVEQIITTRKDQITKYLKYCTNAHQRGWRIVPAFIDPTRSIYSEEMSRDVDLLAGAVQDMGLGGKLDGKDTFSEFVYKLVPDALVFGQINVEKVYNRDNGKILHWRHVPAVTMGVLNNYSFDPKFEINGQYPKYFQQMDGQVNALWWPWEMVFYTMDWDYRDPKSQYGYPRLLKALSIIQGLDRYDEMIDRFFKQGYLGTKIIGLEDSTQENVNETSDVMKGAFSGSSGAFQHMVMDVGRGLEVYDIASTIDPTLLGIRDNLRRALCAFFSMSPEEVNQPMDDHQVSRDRTGRYCG